MTIYLPLISKSLWIALVCFIAAMLWTPVLIRFLRRNKLGKNIRDAESAPIMSKLHAAKAGTPVMGGLMIWVTVLGVVLLAATACGLGLELACRINILSRAQTLLPLGAMVAAALLGLVDDYFNVKRIGPNGGGLRLRSRLLSYAVIAVIAAWWFFTKLDWDIIHIPFVGNAELGLWYVPFFAFVIVATSFSVNETDGLDGLAGGTLLSAFGAYGIIAFAQGKYDLTALCFAIFGALLAFVWHNITPAAFFMGDTGSMALGTVLGIVAMLTNQPLLLPLIGLPFVVESLSVILQIVSKKIFGKKLFLSSPLHHHLEAIGWGEPKIVMRFWVVSFVCAGAGVLIALVDKL